MAKISINLLPPEITAAEKKKSRFLRIQFIGIIVILTMIFFTSLTVALRILQTHNISLIQAKVALAEQQVSDLKDTQVSLFLLKDRLSTIDKFFGVSSKQTAMYQLLDKLIPKNVIINSVNIDRSGSVTLNVLAPDSATLDILITNFTTKDTNEGFITQVLMDSINRGKDGFYRISLKIVPA